VSEVVSLGYGKVNFADASASLAAFVIEPAFARAFPSNSLTRRGKPQVFPATDYEDVGGKLMIDTLEAVEGKLILLQNQQRTRGMSTRDGALFLRLRATGPAYAISAKVPVHRESKIGDTFLVFQGRGDLMSLEEVQDMGIAPTRAWVDGFLQPDEIEQCYDIRELQAEIVARPRQEVVTSLSGKEVLVTANAPGRRIKVRS
jgi:hypothetical protein